MTKRLFAIAVLILILTMLVVSGAALAAGKRYRDTTNYIEPRACMQLEKVYEPACMYDLYLIAHRYLKAKEYDKAIYRFTQILTMKEFFMVYAYRGTAYEAKGEYAKARPDMEKALNLSPKIADFWYGLGRIDFKLKRYIEALDSMNVAIDLLPAQADYHDLRAQIHRAMKNDDRAQADLKRAWEIRDADEKSKTRDQAQKQQ